MSEVYIGIDPGMTGAIAILDGDDIKTYRMPLRKINGKSFLNAWDIYTLLKSNPNANVAIEEVHAMPGNGSVSMFTFGGAYHGILCILEIAGLKFRTVRPQEWQRHFGLARNRKGEPKIDVKKSIQGVATRLFPSIDTAKRDGHADALLMALWLKETTQGGK